MAINTQRDLVAHLKFLTGQDALSNADAARLLNFGLDSYTQLAITSDGNWQTDGLGQSDVSRATATLATGETKLQLKADFITVSQVTIDDGDDTSTLTPYDQEKRRHPVPRTDDTGVPSMYDLYGQHIYFNTYADDDYDVTIHYSRPFVHLEAGNDNQEVGIPIIHTEYPVFFAAYRLMVRNNDPSATQVRNELIDMERKVKDYFARRDEDSPRRLKVRNKVIT
jgi:hypothetical protein